MIRLGKKVQDKVTGFKGIATARIEYINGCVQYCVKPKSKKGEMPDGMYIDEQELVVIGKGITIRRPTEGLSKELNNKTLKMELEIIEEREL